MKKTKWTIGGLSVPVLSVSCAIIGGGLSGLAAGDALHSIGQGDVALFTDGAFPHPGPLGYGNSQSYHTLSLAPEDEDTLRKLALSLYLGEGVSGDIAQVEACCALRAFMKLANMGIPFPMDAYGAFLGHAPQPGVPKRQIPLKPTDSRLIADRLSASLKRRGVPILPHHFCMHLLLQDGRAAGFFCLNTNRLREPHHGLTIVKTDRILLATGSPHTLTLTPFDAPHGMMGMPLEAGALGANLHQWQYGITTHRGGIKLSGAYQRAMPAFYAMDAKGTRHFFLADAYGSPMEALCHQYDKGFRWAFDPRAQLTAPQLEWLIYRETQERGRRVFLSYRENPEGLSDFLATLSTDARAAFPKGKTPYERLCALDESLPHACRERGLPLEAEDVEIGIHPLHALGGLHVDPHYQTNIKGLYAIGEAAATLGPYSPEGSALNAAMVGALRAAEHIAGDENIAIPPKTFSALARPKAEGLLDEIKAMLQKTGTPNLAEMERDARHLMAQWAGMLRHPGRMHDLRAQLLARLAAFFEDMRIGGPEDLPPLYRLRDLYVAQAMTLSAMEEAAIRYGSHGTAIIADTDGQSRTPHGQLITSFAAGQCLCEEWPADMG